MSVKKVVISYEEYGEMANYITKMLKSFKSFSYIVGIPRGGLPLAVHLSHNLGIPLLDYNELSTVTSGNIMVVDDILDTGVTMEEALKVASHLNPFIVVLHWKPQSTITPDIFAKHTTDWVTYPWERKDEVPNRPGYI